MATSTSIHTVLVLGATGNTGLPAVKGLSARGVHVRAGVRDPASEKLAEIRGSPMVEIVHADMSVPSTLPAAMAGATSVLIVTPASEDRTALCMNAVQAAIAAQVPHISMMSVAVTSLQTGYVFAEQLFPVEQAIVKSGLDFTIFRLYNFMENFFGNKQSITHMKTIFGPVEPSAPFTPISVQDIGEFVAAVLASPAPYSRQYLEVAGTVAVTYADVAQYFSEALGETVQYVQVDYEGATQAMVGAGIPAWQAEGIIGLCKLQNARSRTMNLPLEENQFERVVGRPPVSTRDWIQMVKGAFA